MLTAPNWFASTRIFSIMLYPEALVDGAQFSVSGVQPGNVW